MSVGHLSNKVKKDVENEGRKIEMVLGYEPRYKETTSKIEAEIGRRRGY